MGTHLGGNFFSIQSVLINKNNIKQKIAEIFLCSISKASQYLGNSGLM